MAAHVISVFADEPFSPLVNLPRLERTGRHVLEAEGASACELSIAVLDDDAVRRMNRDFVGDDYVTDVLSFSHLEGEELVGPPGETPSLGEVIIAYPQAERQARERARGASGGDALRPFDWAQGRQAQGEESRVVQNEIERLLVHGLLHLLGYDHAEPEEEREMRSREQALAGELSTDTKTD